MPRTKEVIVLYTDDGIGNSIGEIVGEVVRCKDCKHYKEFEGEMECWARPMMFPREPNDFCSMGERREDETC